MRESITSGSIKIHDKQYNMVGLTKSNKIILEVTNMSSIYVADHKTKQIQRNISKDGHIRLDGYTLYVLDVPGVKLHLGIE